MAGQSNLQYEQNRVNQLEGQLGIGPDAKKPPRRGRNPKVGAPRAKSGMWKNVAVTPAGASVDHHHQMPAPHMPTNLPNQPVK